MIHKCDALFSKNYIHLTLIKVVMTFKYIVILNHEINVHTLRYHHKSKKGEHRNPKFRLMLIYMFSTNQFAYKMVNIGDRRKHTNKYMKFVNPR